MMPGLLPGPIVAPPASVNVPRTVPVPLSTALLASMIPFPK